MARNISAKDEKQKAFMSRFEKLCRMESAWQAWSDFVELTAIAISQAVDPRQERERISTSTSKGGTMQTA